MVDEPVRLDFSEAFSAIDALYARFTDAGGAAADQVASTIAAQIASVDAVVPVEVADPGQLTLDLDSAIAAADGSVPVEVADPSQLTSDISGAVASADGAVDAHLANPDELAAEVSDAASSGVASVDVSGGGGGGGGASSLNSLAGAATLAKGAAAGAEGSIRGVSSAVEGLAGETGPAVAGLTALAGVLGVAFTEAADAQVAQENLNRVLGESRSIVDTLHWDDYTASLSTVALALGADDDAIVQNIATFAQLGIAQGESQRAAAEAGAEFTKLALRVAALHPQLGTADEIQKSLQRGLIRGGPILAQYGLAWNQAAAQEELHREGITKNLADLSSYDKIVLATTALNREHGNSYKDIADGAESAMVQIRSLRQGLRESAEAAGASLLGPITDLGSTFGPIIESIIGVIGRAGVAVIELFNPILHEIGPGLSSTFHIVGVAIEAIIPIMAIAGKAIGFVLTPVRLLSEQSDALASFLHDKLPAAFRYIEKIAAEAFLPIIDLVNSLIGAFNRIPFVGDIGKIPTESFKAMADGADNADQKAANLAAKLQVLGDDAQGAVAPVKELDQAARDAADALALAANPIHGQLFSDLATGVETANGEILKLRGIADDAFSVLLKLGDRAPVAMDLLTASFAKGGLNATEFQNVASGLGLTLGELATVETKARENFDSFTSGIAARGDEVAQALGGITDATKELDDKGKANIADFVSEMTTQLTAQAAFSHNIAALFAADASTTAQAFLDAGPKAAGALQQLVEEGAPAIASTEENLRSLSETAKTETDKAATAAEENAARSAAALGKLAPDPSVVTANIDEALLGAQAAIDNKRSAVEASATAIGAAIAQGLAAGVRDGQAEVEKATATLIDAALLSAQSRAEVSSPSRLFSREVGFPLDEGLAQGIRAGFFKVDDAIGDVIQGAQRAAQSQLDTAFGALRAGRSLANAQGAIADLRQKSADLSLDEATNQKTLVSLHGQLNAALVQAQQITAREQQAIDRAQASVDQIRQALTDQANAPVAIGDARAALQLDTAESDRLNAIAAKAANDALLGSGTDAQAKAADAAAKAQQQVVKASQKALDDLTAKQDQNRFSAVDLAVAQEDLTQAQADAIGTTSQVKQLTDDLAAAEQHGKDIRQQLLDVTKQMPDAEIALLEATAAAAKAGDAFNQSGLASLGVLGDIAKQAGFTSTAIADLAKKWGGLSSTIATSLGGGQFGAPAGKVDIGSLLGLAPDFQDPQTALDRWNWVQGVKGGPQATMATAPWNINIYQANDPAVLSGTLKSIIGLQSVR